MDKQNLHDILRAWPWLAFALLTTTIVVIIAPQQVGLLAWAATKLSWGAFLGYWIDRTIYAYSRPHDAWAHASGAKSAKEAAHWRLIAQKRELRRALVIGCTITAIGLGV